VFKVRYAIIIIRLLSVFCLCSCGFANWCFSLYFPLAVLFHAAAAAVTIKSSAGVSIRHYILMNHIVFKLFSISVSRRIASKIISGFNR
jgi:hypothetical protein